MKRKKRVLTASPEKYRKMRVKNDDEERKDDECYHEEWMKKIEMWTVIRKSDEEED